MTIPATETAAWLRYQSAVMAVGSGAHMTFAQARTLTDTYAAWVRAYLDGDTAAEMIAEQRRRVARFLRAKISSEAA
jgi:hypothetical protein